MAIWIGRVGWGWGGAGGEAKAGGEGWGFFTPKDSGWAGWSSGTGFFSWMMSSGRFGSWFEGQGSAGLGSSGLASS